VCELLDYGLGMAAIRILLVNDHDVVRNAPSANSGSG